MMIQDDRFKRVELILGSDACERLNKSFVTIVGLGAVGGYATEAIARVGVGRIRVIDFDKVTLSNINRQLYALQSTLDRPKCEVARERILDINPWCNVEIVDGFIDGTTVSDYIGDNPDIVIDAIDGLNTKVALLADLRSRQIRFISCLGAALRTDPTAVRVAPLAKVHHCPLGSEVRNRLRRRGVPVDFPCIFSEEPMPYPLPIAAPTDRLGDQPAIARGRTRNTLGSLPTITGIFGLTAANLAINMLIGKE
jgi:tRNA A37 threonylcarbamoyladenosine dehydratase